MNTRWKVLLLSAGGVALAVVSLLLPTGLTALLEPLDTQAALPAQARLPDKLYDTPLAAALYLREQAAQEDLATASSPVPLQEALAFVRPLAEAEVVPALPDGTGGTAQRWGPGQYDLSPVGEAGNAPVFYCWVQEDRVVRWDGPAGGGRTAAEILAAYQRYLGLADADWQGLPGVRSGDSAIAWDAETCLYCYVFLNGQNGLSLGVQSRTPQQIAELYPNESKEASQ